MASQKASIFTKARELQRLTKRYSDSEIKSVIRLLWDEDPATLQKLYTTICEVLAEDERVKTEGVK